MGATFTVMTHLGPQTAAAVIETPTWAVVPMRVQAWHGMRTVFAMFHIPSNTEVAIAYTLDEARAYIAKHGERAN